MPQHFKIYLGALFLILNFGNHLALTNFGEQPRVVFFLGLEGSGQEFWYDLLCSSSGGRCEDASGAGSIGGTLRQLFSAADATVFNQFRAEAVEGLSSVVSRAKNAEGAAARTVFLNLPNVASPLNSDETSAVAYQMYSRVNPLGRPDPVLLSELCAEAQVDLRLMVLNRNPLSLFAAMTHAHRNSDNARNQMRLSAFGSTSGRSSDSNVATSSLSAYELRVLHDQLACLQAQLLSIAAGDTNLKKGQQNSISMASASPLGEAGSRATFGGAIWWRERVRIIDPDRVDSRTLDAVLRHIGLLAEDDSHSSSWSSSEGSEGLKVHRNLRLESGTPIPSDVDRWTAALIQYNKQRRLQLGGMSGKSSLNSSNSISKRGTSRSSDPHQDELQRSRRRLNSSGRQHHQQQLRAAVLAHAYEEASEARPPPLAGTNDGIHSRAKSDQVRSVIARAAVARKEAATERGLHHSHQEGGAIGGDESGAYSSVPVSDSSFLLDGGDDLVSSFSDQTIDPGGSVSLPLHAAAAAAKKQAIHHETAFNVLRRPAHTQRSQGFGNYGNNINQGDRANSVDNSAALNEFDSSAANQEELGSDDRDQHHRKLSSLDSSSSSHQEQQLERSVFGGEWRDFVLLYRHFVSRIVLPFDPWAQLLQSRQPTALMRGSRLDSRAESTAVCDGKGKSQAGVSICPNLNVLAVPTPNKNDVGGSSRSSSSKDDSEEALRSSEFDSNWQLLKPSSESLHRTSGGGSTSRSQNAATVVFFAGLEGTGHHALEQVLSHCLKPTVKGTLSRCVTDCLKGTAGPFSGAYEGSEEISQGRVAMQALVWQLASLDLVLRPSATTIHFGGLGSANKAQEEQEAKSAMARRSVAKQLALSLKSLADLPLYRGRVIALNLLCPMRATGQMSYPNGMPNRFEERPLLHPNLRLLAELVTGAGLNFKVVLLHRPPLPILVSTTVKRNFASLAVQSSVLQHNTAVLLAQALQLHPSFIAPCVDYETWFDQRADTGSGINTTHAAAMAAARLGQSLGLSISPPSGRPGSGYDGSGSNKNIKKRGRGEKANRSPDRNNNAEVRRLSHEEQEEMQLQRRRLGRGGVVQSNWKRAEGVPFDPVEAAPLLASFERLHRLFVTIGCHLDGDFLDQNLRPEKDFSHRRLKNTKSANYDHRRNRRRTSIDHASNSTSPLVAASKQALELATTEASQKRRLSNDNCHWQVWNKKRVCNGKVMASLSGSGNLDDSSSSGGSTTFRSSASLRNTDDNGLVEAMDVSESTGGSGVTGGAGHHGTRDEHRSGGGSGKRHSRERIHSPGQGSDPALLKPLGFDVVIAHYSHGLGWLNSALYRLNKTEPTRCFVYLKGLPGGGADALAESLQSPGERGVSKSALMAALNLTYSDIYFKQLPNVGREGHSYVYHLLALYGIDPEGDHGPLPLHSSVDADYAKAMRRTSNPVPDGRVLVFLKDSAPKEGGFDTRHNWRSSFHLISMAEGLTYASRGELFVHAVSWPAHIAEISRRLEEIDLCARREGLAGMNGAPPGVVLRNTGMGASWLAWSIRTEYLPAWRQSNGTLVRAHPVGILKWATARLQDDTAMRHLKAANRICYKGLFAVRAVHATQYPSELWHRVYLQLSEGDNVEAGHYMERLWCPLLYRGPGSAHPPLKAGASGISGSSESSASSENDSDSANAPSPINHDQSELSANADLSNFIGDEPLTNTESDVTDDGHGAVGLNGYHRRFDNHHGQAGVSASTSQSDSFSDSHHISRNQFSLWHDANDSLSHSGGTPSDYAMSQESTQISGALGDDRHGLLHESAGPLFQGKFSRKGSQENEAPLAVHSRSHHSNSAMHGERRYDRPENEKTATAASESSDPHALLAELHALIERHPTGRIHREGAHHIYHSGGLSERVPPEIRDYEWR